MIVMAEDGIEDLLSFDVIQQVNVPNSVCYLFVNLIVILELRQDYHLLEGVIEMFLVVVEGRVGILLNFPLFFLRAIKAISSWIFFMRGVNDRR